MKRIRWIETDLKNQICFYPSDLRYPRLSKASHRGVARYPMRFKFSLRCFDATCASNAPEKAFSGAFDAHVASKRRSENLNLIG